MSSIEKPKNLPLGTGETFAQGRAKETLPALEVKNTVIWVNPAFKKDMPFNIELGKPTNLGIFFTKKPEEYPKEKERKPVIMPEYSQGRSGLLGSVIFKDADGNLWRDVDAKGMGRFIVISKPLPKTVETTRSVGKIFQDPENPQKAAGLMDYEFALRDKNYSEKFLKAGIRTHRVVAISDLEELIDQDGKKISIDEARKQKVISQEIHPVLEIRAFGTKERTSYIDPIMNPGGDERSLQALADAKNMVAQETGLSPQNFSDQDYARWFAETLGKQVAKIANLKLFHGYLSDHNITLDCRIVDLDSVAPVKEFIGTTGIAETKPYSSEQDLYEKDFKIARKTMERMLIGLNFVGTAEEEKIMSIFDYAYKAELKPSSKSKTAKKQWQAKKVQEKKAA